MGKWSLTDKTSTEGFAPNRISTRAYTRTLSIRSPASHEAAGTQPQGDATILCSTQELFALVLACKAYGHLWEGKRVTIRSDSASVCAAVAKRRVKDREMMKWIRELHFIEASGNFVARAVHIAGVDNFLADSLSRDRIPTFYRDFHARFQYSACAYPTRVSVPSLTTEKPGML